MLSGITGQNDWWAQTAANRPPPVPPAGQGTANPGRSSANPTTAPSGDTSSGPVTGGSSPSLAPGMSFMLMMFTSSRGQGPAATAPSSADAGQAAASDPASASASGSQGASRPGAKLLADLESLFTTLTGSGGSPGNGGAQPATASTATGNSAGSTPTTATATATSSTLLQDLQTIASDMSALASASGGTQTASTGASAAGSPPPQADDRSNDAPGATTGRRHPGYSDSYRMQFALSSYTTSSLSSGNAPTAASVGISA